MTPTPAEKVVAAVIVDEREKRSPGGPAIMPKVLARTGASESLYWRSGDEADRLEREKEED